VDLLTVYRAVDALGVDRVGIADTVGVARPREVYELVSVLRSMVDCDIEFHGHNDTGCAVANSYCALEAGATHVDTSVLGIGERNGITPLGGLVARLYAEDPALVKDKYDLPLLVEIDSYVADVVEISVPFSNYITGATAFTHKAGIHAKAMINSPKTYEILDPKDFGLQRYIDITNRLAGWNGIKERASQLNLQLSEDEIKAVTTRIKDLSYQMKVSLEDVDQLLKDAANLGRKSLAA